MKQLSKAERHKVYKEMYNKLLNLNPDKENFFFCWELDNRKLSLKQLPELDLFKPISLIDNSDCPPWFSHSSLCNTGLEYLCNNFKTEICEHRTIVAEFLIEMTRP